MYIIYNIDVYVIIVVITRSDSDVAILLIVQQRLLRYARNDGIGVCNDRVGT